MAQVIRTDRRHQQAQATSGQLLAAAREVFEKKGYHATTVGAITEAARTAHGTFYLYFKNKEDAFAKVFASVVAELDEESKVPWEGETRATIHRAVSGHFSVVARHRGLWCCVMEGMYQSPAIEQLWLQRRRVFIDRLTEALTAGAGGTDAGPAPRALAVAIGSMIEWTAYTVIELEEPEEVDVEQVVAAVVELWYRVDPRR